MCAAICFVKLHSLGAILGLTFLSVASAAMYGANALLLGVIPMNFAKYNMTSTIAGFLDFCSYLATGIAVCSTGVIVDRYGWNGVVIGWILLSLLGMFSVYISWRNKNDSK